MEIELLLDYLLPKDFQIHFDIIKIEEAQEEGLLIHLDEKSIKPSEHSDKELVSKGFDEAVQIQDFPISSNSLEKHYHINGTYFGRQYKEHLSNYKEWDQKEHAKEWMLFPDNIGTQLSIDETSLSNGELYTILTNKAGKGKKGTIVAMVEGTSSNKIIEVIKRIPKRHRATV